MVKEKESMKDEEFIVEGQKRAHLAWTY